ncbi:DEAD/DEAH box helicase family protein [Vreelandella sedimenti]|uniref:DEAD/DEAH box helicase family protein n=1 Tax=Vreelandella sedimenti TaxID=2729618 RepID=UPI00257E4D9F|nr:DEAD/DEAH box helicase family protein [Halomonas sp. UBA3173]|tara:strand:+ start:158257 stop:159828 length:1572 start_codon:yes stop_codon:yes gene_type:complete
MSRKLTTIYADKSITGSGKSYAAIRHCINKQQKTLIVVPSLVLANEYERDINQYASNESIQTTTKVVTSEKTGKNQSTVDLLSATIASLKSATSASIITTHETFKLALLSNFTDFKGFHLLIDENIQLNSNTKCDLTKMSAANVLSWFDFTATHSDLYEMRMKSQYHGAASKIGIKSINDDFINDDKIDFIDFTRSDSFTTYITKDSYHKACDVVNTTDVEAARIYTLSVINKAVLQKFNSVTILAALFDMSELRKYLEIAGFTIKYKKFSDRETEKHTNGSRLKIHCLTYRNNSLNFKSLISDSQKMDNEDLMVTYLMQNVIKDNKFIFNNNVAARDKRVYTHYQALPHQHEMDGQGVLVTATAGVNKYSHINYALYTSSRNIDNAEKQIIEKFGIDEAYANADRNLLAAYQFIARTSIRDPHATDDVHICVIDNRTAEFLASLYPGAEIIKHEVPGLEDYEQYRLPPARSKAGKGMRRVIKSYESGIRKFREDARKNFCDNYEQYPVTDYYEIYQFLKNYK